MAKIKVVLALFSVTRVIILSIHLQANDWGALSRLSPTLSY